MVWCSDITGNRSSSVRRNFPREGAAAEAGDLRAEYQAAGGPEGAAGVPARAFRAGFIAANPPAA